MKQEKLTASQARAMFSGKPAPAKARQSARAKPNPDGAGQPLEEVRVEYGPVYEIHWIPAGSPWLEFWQAIKPTRAKNAQVQS